MHPVLADRRRLLLYLAIFLQAGWLFGELVVATSAIPRLAAMALALPLFALHGFSCLASWYVCRGLPLGSTRPERLLGGLLVAAVGTSSLLVVVGEGWARVLSSPFVRGAGHVGDYTEWYSGQRTAVFVFAVLLFSLAVALHYLFLAQAQSRSAERRALELAVLAREAELRALRAQIDPHFLFNSLSSISARVTAAPLEARQMCERLAEFFRQSLRLGRCPAVPVSLELDLVRVYLEVERLRFEDRLAVEIACPEDCLEVEIPPLMLQPLVENGVRHGIAQLVEGGIISIGIRSDGRRLLIRVENPCDPDRPREQGEGIGLRNVRERLATAYNHSAELEIKDLGRSFVAELTLPVMRSPEGTS